MTLINKNVKFWIAAKDKVDILYLFLFVLKAYKKEKLYNSV